MGDQSSLVAHLRACGRTQMADRLAALSPAEFRQYLADFAKRHAPQLSAMEKAR